MKIKFEKEISELNALTGENEVKKVECEEREAKFKHICYHDENPLKSCVRVPYPETSE